MIRLLLLILLLFLAVVGFDMLKDTSGGVEITIGNTVYATGLGRGALGLLIVVLAMMIIVWILLLIIRAPGRAGRAWHGRREEKTRAVLARGLLAIASGDLGTAERAAREAGRREPKAPLTLLLRAQAAQLKGDREGAHAAFRDMLDDPRTQIVGLHGLFIEAERAGETATARHFATKARELAPATGWASRAVLRNQIAEGDWDGALATINSLESTRAIDKQVGRRQRAVVQTAQAMNLEDAEPDRAKKLAADAHLLAPDLVPAAVVASRLMIRLGETRRAAKILETGWKAAPHPEIADAYGHLRSGDSARDRLKRAQALAKVRPQADEGRIAVARAAIDARDWHLARETLTPLIKTRPSQNALILMADIEEAEHGDKGRAREWLARAVHALPDKAWVADGMVLDGWAPASPVTGRIDTVEWKVPSARLTEPDAIAIEEDALRPRPLMITTPEAAPAEPGETAPAAAPPAPASGESTEPLPTPATATAPETKSSAPETAKEPATEPQAGEPPPAGLGPGTAPAKPTGDGAGTAPPSNGEDRIAAEVSPAAEPGAKDDAGIALSGDADVAPKSQSMAGEPEVAAEELETQRAKSAQADKAADDKASGLDKSDRDRGEAEGDEEPADAASGEEVEEAETDKEKAEPRFPPIPDDPGVPEEPPDKAEAERGFRLFKAPRTVQ